MDKDKDPDSPFFDVYHPSTIINDFISPIDDEKARELADKHGVPIPPNTGLDDGKSNGKSVGPNTVIDASDRFGRPSPSDD